MTGEQAQDPLLGTKIGPCRIEARLAAGGMGVVYRAKLLTADKVVALKILAPSLAADQEYVTRFFREAGAAGQIEHPNVVRVIDVGKHEDLYYLVMEFVEGETLDHLLERDRRISLETATRMIREIADGLSAAHRAGIVHRDVKPGNVIVARDGTPRLTDFGLARVAESRKEGLTVEGTFLGTPEYASPEQVEGRKLDHRTDLYSLGVTYYHLLSGTLPFLGESPMAMAIKRTKEDPRSLESAFPGADPRACQISRKLLEREPGRRYQNATELIQDLDAILTGKNLRAARGPDSELTQLRVSVAAQRRIRSFLHWMFVGLAVLLAFGSGAIAERGRFLEQWSVRDAEFSLRVGLLAASVLATAAAVLVYRRELVSGGRIWTPLLLMPLMVLGALVAGLMLDRAEGGNAAQTLIHSAGALVRSADLPVNRLAVGVFLFWAAAVLSFEHEVGSMRVTLCRLAVLVGFALIYAFGTAGVGLLAPVRNFMAEPELSIPVATATALACFFGTLLVTGYDFERVARTCGVLLVVGGAVGVYSSAVLISQPDRNGWPELLIEPLTGLRHSFVRSGTLLTMVAALAILSRSIVAAGVRAHDRFYRKK